MLLAFGTYTVTERIVLCDCVYLSVLTRDYGFMLYLDRQDFFLMHVHVCVCGCVSVHFSRVTFSSDLD
jgi:hypothetical protein